MVKIRSTVFDERIVVVGIISVFLALIAVVMGIPRAIGFFDRQYAAQEVAAIERAFGRELERVEVHLKEFTEMSAVREALQARDDFRLLAVTTDGARIHGLDTISVTDRNGVVLARSSQASRRGEYFFEMTPIGAAMTEEEGVTSLEGKTTWWPIFASAQPIHSAEGDFIGAALGGGWVDQDYVDILHREVVNVGTEIVVLNRENRVVGTSFDDLRVGEIIEAYFAGNAGRDGAVLAGMQKGVRIEDDYFTVQNVPLTGLRGASGRILLFVPSSLEAVSILFAAFVVFIFFLFTLMARRIFQSHSRREHIELIVAVSSFILFLVLVAAIYGFLRRGVQPLVPPHQTIYNSTMSFDPETWVVDVRSEQRIAIRIATGGEVINAAQATVVYDPDQVAIKEIVTEKSFCASGFWLERQIDADQGIVSIACGLPNPGYAKPDAILVELIVQPKRPGSFTLRFDPLQTKVLANDGLGTDVLRVATDGSYQSADIASSTVRDGALPIFSFTHPNSERWYQATDVHLTWPLLSGYSYLYALSEGGDAPPQNEMVSVAEKLIEFEVPHDGVHYFHLVPFAPDGRSVGVSRFKIQVDVTPPVPPVVKMSNSMPEVNEVVRFEFSSEDQGSGLQSSYYVRIDDGIFLPIGSQLFLPFLQTGTHRITVRAFDRANNYSDTTVEISVKKGR